MSEKRPKVVFLHGDEDKALTFLKNLRKEWYPQGFISCEWEEYDSESPKNKKSNTELVLESISCPPLNECYRTFVLKTTGDDAHAREMLIKSAKNIPDNTTLIVWDVRNPESLKKAASPTMDDVKASFKLNGKVVDAGKPLSGLSAISQVAWLIKTGEENGLTISKDCAELMLELYDSNRAIIEGEIVNLSFMSDGILEKSTLVENAMPIQKDFPIYKFYTAFNSGEYRLAMDAAQELIERGFPVDIIIGYAVKQTRWQVVVADALRKKKDPYTYVGSFGTSDYSKSRKKVESDRSITKEILLEDPLSLDEKERPKKEKAPTGRTIKEIVEFLVGKVLTKHIPPTEKDKRRAVYEQVMKRYILLLNGMLELRTCKSDEKEACFSKILRKVTYG
jgi:hypothetical protein